MMLVALLADVHANLPALDAVLREARLLGASSYVCLGDLVGYNAHPNECLASLANASVVCLLGNHDKLALGESDPLASKPARDVAHWTARTLSSEARRFLCDLPCELNYGWGSLVHGSWLNARRISGYVTATMAPYNLASLRRAAPETARYLGAFGHTHRAIVHYPDGTDVSPQDGDVLGLPEGEIALVNPGSVGQPRDGDPRAAFALLDLRAWRISFRRVPYDIDQTVDAILCAGLDASLAKRLYEAT